MAWFRCGGTPSNILALPTPSEASGAIARFNTDLTENLLSAVAEFSASQASGTPTPSAPIPIVGVDKVNVMRTGKNLIAGTIASAGINASGVIISSTTNNIIYTRCKAGQKYTITSSGSILVYAFYTSEPIKTSESYNSSHSQVNLGTATITAEIDGWVAIRITNTDTTPQIEYGEQSTAYEAPTVVDKTINLGGTYYGGSVDAVTGKIIKTISEPQDLSLLNWNATSSPHIFYTTFTGKKAGYASKIICEQYSFYEGYFSSLGNYQISGNSTYQYIYIRNDDCDTKEELIAALSGCICCCELATPIVVYASNTAEIPTIVGDNQVFADTGDVALKYFETVGHKI